MDSETAYLILNMLPGIGPVKVRRLLDSLGSAPQVFATSQAELGKILSPRLAAVIARWEDHVNLDAELGRVEALGAQLITWENPKYPPHLRQISDPPILLYMRGTYEERDKHAIAVVGTRNISSYGREVTRMLSFQLARAGYTIVSGLARGVDTVAHEAAIAAKGRTIAVLGSGLSKLTPAENKVLAERILESGAVISQFPIDYNGDRQSFPIRNRIVSGMSYGVLVVEGSKTSGAMITANQALEQGRHVFAVPGPIDKPNSAGPHALIQDGAKLVSGVEDILEELGVLQFDEGNATPEPVEVEVKLEGDEKQVYEALTDVPMGIEELASKTNLPSPTLSSTLLRLEMKRLVRQLPGIRFEKLI